MSVDYYRALGVPRNASEEAIKAAFRGLAKRLHPDLNPNDATAEAAFKALNEAYSTLSDPSERRKYDMLHGSAGLGTPGRGGGGRGYTAATPPHHSHSHTRDFREGGERDTWSDFLREEADRGKAAERLRAAASRGRHEGPASHFDGWEERRAARVAAAEASAAAAAKGVSETGHYRAYAGQWRAARQGGVGAWPILALLAISTIGLTLASNGTIMALKRQSVGGAGR
jgi:curved DNA-binding protein CbpA